MFMILALIFAFVILLIFFYLLRQNRLSSMKSSVDALFVKLCCLHFCCNDYTDRVKKQSGSDRHSHKTPIVLNSPSNGMYKSREQEMKTLYYKS